MLIYIHTTNHRLTKFSYKYLRLKIGKKNHKNCKKIVTTLTNLSQVILIMFLNVSHHFLHILVKLHGNRPVVQKLWQKNSA